jgi:hypothetical protein
MYSVSGFTHNLFAVLLGNVGLVYSLPAGRNLGSVLCVFCCLLQLRFFVIFFLGVQGERNVVISRLFFLICLCCVFGSLVFGFYVLGEELVFPVYPVSFAHAPRYVWSAVSPLPLLRLFQRHWGLASLAPSWYFGAPFPMCPWARVAPGIARLYLHGMTTTASLSTCCLCPFTALCMDDDLWMCVLLLDVALVLGTIVLAIARMCCCANSCFRELTVIFVNPSVQFGGRLCRAHAIFRLRLLTYAAFWKSASSLSLTPTPS